MANESLPLTNSRSRVFSLALTYAGLLYLLWFAAWLLERWLEHRFASMGSSAAQFSYWLVMKLLLWVLPAILIFRFSGRRFLDVLGLKRLLPIVLWGGGVGSLLAITAFVSKFVGGKAILPASFGWPFLNAVLVAPVVEEITFRGAVLGSLKQRYRFAIANSITALLFLGAHLPGWYFQGRVLANLITPVGGALSIFLVGFVFGYVAHRSDSVAASVLAHALNNLGSF
jgi:membrane protease YdiL (CAAX protease family)